MGIFNQEGKLYGWMNRCSDIMLCNVCFIIGSLPLFTIGASLTAMYSICFKIRARQNPSVWSEFWISYKQNLKQATILWVAYVGLASWFVFCAYLFVGNADKMFQTYFVLMIILLVFLLLYGFYLFSLLAMFENKTIDVLKKAFVIMFANLLMTFMIGLWVLTVGLLSFYNVFTMLWAIVIGISFGIALLTYSACAYLEKVYDRYTVIKSEEQ